MLGVLVIVAVSVALLRRSRLGSAMLAVRANERSAAGAGINVVRVKILAFAIAAFIAGLGGAMLGYKQGNLTFDPFDVLIGIGVFATAYLAGITSVSGGILAGMLAAGGIVYYATTQWLDLGDWYGTITGVGLVLTVVLNPEGIVGPFHVMLEKMRTRPRHRSPWRTPDSGERRRSRRARPLAGSRAAVAPRRPRRLRRRRRGRRPELRRRRGQHRRTHRPQRRREDHAPRRHQRLRGRIGIDPARRPRARPSSNPTSGSGRDSAARSSRSSSTTTCRCARTSRWASPGVVASGHRKQTWNASCSCST